MNLKRFHDEGYRYWLTLSKRSRQYYLRKYGYMTYLIEDKWVADKICDILTLNSKC